MYGEWDDYVASEGYILWGELCLLVEQDGSVHINVGDNLYYFGFWDDSPNHYDIGLVYVVYAFNQYDPADGSHPLWTYFFDEEVDVSTLDLTGVEPIYDLISDRWCYDVPDLYIAAWIDMFGAEPYFYVTNNGLEFDYNQTTYWYEWYDYDLSGIWRLSIDDYDPNHKVVYDEGDNEIGYWSYNLERDRVEVFIESHNKTYYLKPSTKNLGEVKLNVGQVFGVIDMGYSLSSYSWIALTSEGLYNYFTGAPLDDEAFAEIVGDIMAGKMEPSIRKIAGYTWKVENGYYVVYYGKEPMFAYELEDSGLLTPYVGEVIYEYVDETRDGENKLTDAFKTTFNNVCGHQMAFGYYALIDEGVITDWVLSEDAGKWEIDEHTGFLNLYMFAGVWELVRSFAVVENEGEYELQTLGVVSAIVNSGYAYVNIGGDYYTLVVVLAYDVSHNPLSFIFAYEGKLAADEVPTIADILATSQEDFEADGGVDVANPGTSSWEWCGDYDLNGRCVQCYCLTVDSSMHSIIPVGVYPLYKTGSTFECVPSGYTLDYSYVVGDETYVYLHNLQEPNRSLICSVFGSYDEDEVRHALEISLNYDPDASWKIVEKEGNRYLCTTPIDSSFICWIMLIGENGPVELEVAEYVYAKDVNIGGEKTWLFCDVDGIAKIVFTTGELLADETAIEEALAGIITGGTQIAGVWLQDGDYVQYLSWDFLFIGSDTENDVIFFETYTSPGELTESVEPYNGTVDAILPIEGESYTLVLWHYFDDYTIFGYNGTLVDVDDAQGALDACNLVETDHVEMITSDFWLVYPLGVVCDISNGTFEEVEGEVVYWMFDGPIYMFMRLEGGEQVVVMALDENFDEIVEGPSSPDNLYYTYVGEFYGIWYEDTTGDSDILIYYAFSGEAWPYIIVNALTGEVMVGAIP